MQIDLRDRSRNRIGRIDLDPALRPTRVGLVESGGEVFLDWETAVDDAGHLRRCVACGCPEVFREKAFPPATGFVVALAFAGAVIGALGFATQPPVLMAMGVVLAFDIAILVFSRQRLVCYRCRTSYRGLPIARYHRRWDRATADRYPARSEGPPLAPAQVAPAGARAVSTKAPAAEAAAPREGSLA
ncbi:MAG: hypothetical protein ACYSTY_01385 [Planctomycetota bacterium]|jgi:hypothetical protein